MFGYSSKKKKTTLASRVKKLKAKVAKKQRIASLKSEEAKLRKQLRGY